MTVESAGGGAGGGEAADAWRRLGGSRWLCLGSQRGLFSVRDPSRHPARSRSSPAVLRSVWVAAEALRPAQP